MTHEQLHQTLLRICGQAERGRYKFPMQITLEPGSLKLLKELLLSTSKVSPSRVDARAVLEYEIAQLTEHLQKRAQHFAEDTKEFAERVDALTCFNISEAIGIVVLHRELWVKKEALQHIISCEPPP
jgi:hypothetical protein